MRLRTCLLAVAALLGIGAATAPSPASAGLLDDLLSGPGGVLGQTLGEIDTAACGPFAETPLISDVVCQLGITQVKYRTTYRRPNGTEFVRTTNGTVAVPSLLRVDEDLLHDVTATLLPTSTTRFLLKVQRNVLVTGDLPVKLEVILADPSGDLERDNLYFGFDTRNGRTPGTWTAEIRILESTEKRTALAFEVTKAAGGAVIPRIAMIGGMFDGDPGQRTQPIEAVLDQRPMPDTFAAALVLAEDANGQDDYVVGLGASSPVRLDGSVHVVDGLDERTINASVSDLPTTMTAELDGITADSQRIGLLATHRVGSLGLTSDHRRFNAPVDRVQIDLTDVPQGVTYEQTSRQTGTITTGDDSPIGSARLVYSARGYQAPLLPSTGAFAQYETPQTFQHENPEAMLAVRVEKLVRAEYDMSAGTAVDLITRDSTPTSARQDFALRAAERDTRVDGTVADLPPHVTFSMTKAGRIDYDGHGATVPLVTAAIRTLNGTTLSPAVRYTAVDASLHDLPPLVGADIAPDGNRFSAATENAPIGLLEAEAYNAQHTCLSELPGAQAGAVLVETPSRACVAGRFAGMKSVDVGLKPLNVDVHAAAGQPLTLKGTFNKAGDAIVADGHLSGVIDQVPADFSMTSTLGAEPETATSTTFAIENGAEVDRIALVGSDLPDDFPGRFLDVELVGVPRKATLELPIEGRDDRMTAVMGDGADIDSITAEVRSGGPSCLADLGTGSGMAFADVNGVTCAGGRFLGLRSTTVEMNPLVLQIRSSAAQRFAIEGRFNDPLDEIASEGRLSGAIEDLPTDLSVEANPGVLPQFVDRTRIVISNDQPIDRIHLTGTDLPEVFPGRFLSLDLVRVPRQVTVELPIDGGEDQIRAVVGEGAHLDSFEAEVRTGGESCLANLGSHSGMAFNDVDGVTCAAGRFLGLKSAEVELEPLGIEVTSLVSQYFRVEGRLNDPADSVVGTGVLTATITDLPRTTSLQQSAGTVATDPEAETLKFDIATMPAIGEIVLVGTNLPDTFPAPIMTARIEGLPVKVGLEIPTEGVVKKVRLTTEGGGIDYLRFALTDGVDVPTTPEGEDAVVVLGDDIAVQVHDLQEAEFISPLNASPRMSGTASAKVVHDEDAKPLSVHVDTGGTVVDLSIPAPPRTLGFERPGQNSPDQDDAQQDVIKFRSSAAIQDAVFKIKQGDALDVNLDVSDIPARTNLCLWTGNGALTSSVAAHNPAMCYQPSKTPFSAGGDPFTVLDTLQLTLDDLDDAMVDPVTINNLKIRTQRASDDWSETEILFAQLGQTELAFGSSTIYPDASTEGSAAQAALYGDIFDGAADQNEGAHIALNTDDIGVRVLLHAERLTPGVEDKIGFTDLRLLPAEPLVADHKVLALDLTNFPTKTYDRGSLEGCSSDADEMQLVVDVADTVNYAANGLELLGLLGCLTE